VAHVQDVRSGLSGKDTAEQHAAFWKYSIIPALRNFEQIIETQFFGRFGLKEQGIFNTADIPELQESEAERSKRDISEIEAGIKTINDVLIERGLEKLTCQLHLDLKQFRLDTQSASKVQNPVESCRHSC